MNRDHYLGGAVIACICMLLAGFIWAIQPKNSSQNPNVNSSQVRTVPMANRPRLIVDPEAVRNYTPGTSSEVTQQSKPAPKPRIRTIYTTPRSQGPTQTMPLESQRAPE
jgi:hypothetical protein